MLGDLTDLSPIAGELSGLDACFFCLGVSSAGMSEAEYRRVTYDLTMSVARTLVKTSPAMTFVYVSGTNTEQVGHAMWRSPGGAHPRRSSRIAISTLWEGPRPWRRPRDPGDHVVALWTAMWRPPSKTSANSL
jgi:hypothetical protein